MLPDDERQMLHVLVRRRFICMSSPAHGRHRAVAAFDCRPALCSVDPYNCHLTFQLDLDVRH